MKRQTSVNENVRAILVDWIINVHIKFKLLPETLFLTINLIDRYLSLEVIEKQNAQLLGVAALMISSKYEEIYPPSV
jgi:cyclin B